MGSWKVESATRLCLWPTSMDSSLSLQRHTDGKCNLRLPHLKLHKTFALSPKHLLQFFSPQHSSLPSSHSNALPSLRNCPTLPFVKTERCSQTQDLLRSLQWLTRGRVPDPIWAILYLWWIFTYGCCKWCSVCPLRGLSWSNVSLGQLGTVSHQIRAYAARISLQCRREWSWQIEKWRALKCCGQRWRPRKEGESKSERTGMGRGWF